MIFKFSFESDAEFLECKNYNLSRLTELLKVSDTAPVKFKLMLIDLADDKVVQNLKLFITNASSLGVYPHLIDRPLDSQINDLLGFAEDSGLYASLDNTNFEKFQTSNNEFALLEGENSLANGGEILFYLKFVPDNSHENNRFFIGLDARGETVNATE